MEFFSNVIRALYVVFLIYSLFYMAHWVVGLFISIHRLSRFEETQEQITRIFPLEIARKVPVSVIIPAHNESACICDTVAALLKAEYPSLEIIVVDDGSTDGTSDLLTEHYDLKPSPYVYSACLKTQPVREYYKNSIGDKQLVLIQKENGGKADALNCGLNFSHNAYCVMVDADTQIRPDAIRIMAHHFMMDRRTVVCAGAVGTLLHCDDLYRKLSPVHKLLVMFQHMEYYRTFYMQRVLFNTINANVIVSGAFAMFDRQLVMQAGGYRTNTIGEDMELTMRLHAFCMSQHREYKIVYAPEARCDTQVPFRYRDYFRQRRRWHIGMIQSLRHHLYMIGNRYYGFVGTLSVLFTLIYELLAPTIEIAGVVLLVFSAMLDMLDPVFACTIAVLYLLISLMTQSLLLDSLDVYGVEPVSVKQHILLILTAATEAFLFHPINMIIKIGAQFTYRKHKATWSHIKRVHEDKSPQPETSPAS